MLRKELNAYLIVAKSEGCCPEEYTYRGEVLKEFLSLTGDIPCSQLRRKHITDFILLRMEESITGEQGPDHVLRARFTLERFLLWLQSQQTYRVIQQTAHN